MFGNYLSLAWRNLHRHPGYTLINAGGLAAGLLCCLLIALFVRHELSFDRFHQDADRLFRIGLRMKQGSGSQSLALNVPPLAPAIRRSLPEVEEAARLFPFQQTRTVRRGNDTFLEEGFCYADRSLFRILTFRFLEGKPETALGRPGTVVIPERLARKYFSGRPAAGQRLEIDGRPYLVTGVVADAPANSHQPYDLFTAMEDLGSPAWLEDWNWPGMATYIKAVAFTDPELLARKLQPLARQAGERKQSTGLEFFLQPVTGIYLDSRLEYEYGPQGDRTRLLAFSLIGLLVLAAACFNCMNLATARLAQRSREAGIRKVAGAGRRQLLALFGSESLLISGAALLAAAGGLLLIKPWFGRLTGAELSLNGLWSAEMMLVTLALLILTSLLAGGYPALLLSAASPAVVLRESRRTGTRGGLLRKVLVTSQFAVAMALIIGLLVLLGQVDFLKSKHPGFVKANKLIVRKPPGVALDPAGEPLKTALARLAGVTAVCLSDNVPGQGAGLLETRKAEAPSSAREMMHYLFCDESFVPVYGIKMLAGRNFDRNMATDLAEACLINETACRTFGWASPEGAIGKVIITGLYGKRKTIIGVTGGFHFQSLAAAIGPLVLEIEPGMAGHPATIGHITVQAGPAADPRQLIPALEATWRRLFPRTPFDCFQLEEFQSRLYQNEEQAGILLGAFAAAGLLIACLGLLALSALVAQQRIREIGIRKALGASGIAIAVLLTREWLRLVLLAFVLAWPPAVLAMRYWLEQFPYRTPLPVWTPLLAGLLVLILALAAAGGQTLRAALAPPVKSLRHE